MNIRREIFDIFNNSKEQYDLYEKVIEYVVKVIEDTEGHENANFYSIISQLMNSINNAGWEERHSQQIDFLFKIENQISKKYEKYLF